MRQHRAEPLHSLAFAIPHDLRNQAAVIVVEYRLRHRAEERKRMYMAVQPSLSVRSGIGADIAGITVWKIQRKKVRFLLNTADHNQRFTKVSLRMSRRMAERHKHLA